MVEKALELYRKYREMILYLVFGGLTTLVNIFSYFVLTDVGEIQYLVSTAIAWVLSVLFAYFTNRVWVFQSTASGTKAILREIGSFFRMQVAVWCNRYGDYVFVRFGTGFAR